MRNVPFTERNPQSEVANYTSILLRFGEKSLETSKSITLMTDYERKLALSVGLIMC